MDVVPTASMSSFIVYNARLGRLVQVVIRSFALLSYALVHLAYVDTGAILGQKVLTLQLVELGRLLQEGVLEKKVVEKTKEK